MNVIHFRLFNLFLKSVVNGLHVESCRNLFRKKKDISDNIHFMHGWGGPVKFRERKKW